jgi:RecA-family ATPase
LSPTGKPRVNIQWATDGNEPAAKAQDAAPPPAPDNVVSFNKIVRHPGMTFLSDLLLDRTTALIAVESLANDKPLQFPPRSIQTRDTAKILDFVTEYNRAERGVFFGPATVKGPRSKDNVAELVLVWSDLDFKHIDETPDEVLEQLKHLPLAPHIIIFSGHGYHCYWRIKMLAATAENKAKHEAALKALARILAADSKVAQCAALMRLPGTHNSKDGGRIEVTTVFEQTERGEYDIEEIETWLATAEPVLHNKEIKLVDGGSASLGPKNPFDVYGESLAHYAERVDVEARLAAMRYQGHGETSVHATELSVTASMARCDPDANVEYVLWHVEQLNIRENLGWNMQDERQTLRRMLLSWYGKHPELLPETVPPWVSNDHRIQEALRASTNKAEAVHSEPQEPAAAVAEAAKAAEAPKSEARKGPVPFTLVEDSGGSDPDATVNTNGSGAAIATPPSKPEPITSKVKPLIIRLAEQVWGSPYAGDGKTVAFKDGNVVVDVGKNVWFDFEHNIGGSIRELIQETKQQGQQQDTAFPLIDIRAWHGKWSPPRDWAVVNRVPVEAVSGLYGDGGVGKTILLLQLAVCIALGIDWLGAKVPVSGAVLIMCCEDNVNELWRRLEKIVEYYDTDFVTLWDCGFRIGTYAGKDAMMAYFEQGIMKTTVIWDAIYKQAKAIPNLRFIGIDNAADVFAGNEIDRRQVRQFITKLHGLAIEIIGAVMLTAHPSLTGMNTGTGTSGSTGWNNAFRSRMYFRKEKQDKDNDGEIDKDYRELEVMKINYAAEGEVVELRWQDGVFVPAFARVEFVDEPSDPPDPSATKRAEDEEFLMRLDEFEQAGRPVSDKPKAGNYAPVAFAKAATRAAKARNARPTRRRWSGCFGNGEFAIKSTADHPSCGARSCATTLKRPIPAVEAACKTTTGGEECAVIFSTKHDPVRFFT